MIKKTLVNESDELKENKRQLEAVLSAVNFLKEENCFLLNKKDALKQRILDQYKKYAMIDRVFSDEIQHAETVSYFFSWGRKRNREIEPIVREFMATYGI